MPASRTTGWSRWIGGDLRPCRRRRSSRSGSGSATSCRPRCLPGCATSPTSRRPSARRCAPWRAAPTRASTCAAASCRSSTRPTALDRLAARGLLDDRRFAEQYAAFRAARGKGPARLVTDLLAHGVERRVAEEAVRRALADEGIDPAIEARAVAAKRARQLSDLPGPVRKRRLLAFLVRRGYAGAGVKELVEELCGGTIFPP
ncbi:MAG: hypothetical protein DMD65_07395 [Gemmatimonadetes bacterium]|nr:MAG: hypothetical protein DMD65_07395 [Gemmatimonadota bacterium]